MSILPPLLIYSTILYLAFLVAIAIAMKLNGVPIQKMKLFYGPTPIGFTTRGCRIEIGVVPLGAVLQPNLEIYESQSIPTRIGIQFCSVGGVFLIAVLSLGIDGASSTLSRSIVWFFQGAFSPTSLGVHLIERWHQTVTASFAQGLGALAAVHVGTMLLPLGVGPGANVLYALVGKHLPPRLLELFQVASTFALLGLHCSWFVALATYVMRQFLVGPAQM